MNGFNRLKHNFLLFSIGQGISKLGSALTYYEISLEVLKTSQDMRMFALALSLKFIPQIVLYPVAGTFVDRVNKKKLMMIIDLLRGMFLVMSTLIIVNNPSVKGLMMFIIIIVLSLFEVLYNPASSALIPCIFKSSELININTTLSWINSAATVIAPLLGSVMYLKFGIARVLAIDSATYFIVGFLLLHVVVLNLNIPGKSSKGWISEFKVGFEIILQNKDLRLSTIAIGVSRFFVNSFYSIGVPVIIIQFFKVTEVMLGSVQTMLMIGALMSPLVLSLIHI